MAISDIPPLLTALPLPRFDGSAPFRQGRDLLVPARGGVYLLHDLRGLLYVGRTSDLRRRFAQHYWLASNPYLKLAVERAAGELLYSWVFSDGADRESLEIQLITAYQPPCNRLRY